MSQKIYLSVPSYTKEVSIGLTSDNIEDMNVYKLMFDESLLCYSRTMILLDDDNNVIETIVKNYDKNHENEFEIWFDSEGIGRVNVYVFIDDVCTAIRVTY